MKPCHPKLMGGRMLRVSACQQREALGMWGVSLPLLFLAQVHCLAPEGGSDSSHISHHVAGCRSAGLGTSLLPLVARLRQHLADGAGVPSCALILLTDSGHWDRVPHTSPPPLAHLRHVTLYTGA